MNTTGPLVLLLAFAAGGATVLSFAPFHQAWLAPLTLALLFRAWMQVPPAAAFRLGWAWGAGLLSFGLFWLHHSIARFGGIDLPVAMGLTLLLAVLLALYYALPGWLSALWLPPGPVRLPALAAFWVLGEWLRGHLFTGLTWLDLGYGQVATPLAGYVPLGGVLAASLAVALTAALLARWDWRWLLGGALLWAGGWQLQQHEWTEPAGSKLSVALVQPDIPQELKWRPEQFEPTLRLLQSLSDQVPDARLVIWPETAVPAFADQVETAVLEPLHRHYRQQGRTLLLGIPVRAPGGRDYNALLALGADGRQHYYKRHLVPFGEYMPFDRLLRPLARSLAIPMSNFSAGTGRPLMILGGLPTGVSICYEDTFGAEVMKALPEAAFLVNVSNDAWFGDSLGPRQHLQMAQMRALETGRELVRVTNTGISAFIDHRGRLRARLALQRQGVLSDPVRPRQGLTPRARWGDGPLFAVAGLLLLFSALLALGAPRQRR